MFGCFVFVMGGLMFVIENSHQNEDGIIDDLLDSIYMLIVVRSTISGRKKEESRWYNMKSKFSFQTISTVGYGDYTPKTYVGKVAIMLIIIAALAMLPYVLSMVVEAWQGYHCKISPFTHSHTPISRIGSSTLTLFDSQLIWFILHAKRPILLLYVVAQVQYTNIC